MVIVLAKELGGGPAPWLEMEIAELAGWWDDLVRLYRRRPGKRK